MSLDTATSSYDLNAFEPANTQSVSAHLSRRAERLGGIGRVLMKDAAIVAITLLGVEMLLRVVVPGYGNDFYDRGLTASHPVIFNSEGYRGPAVPLAKVQGEERILALGDSTTFGTGVAVEETWPMQLREKLAATSADPVSVMNVALQGTALRDLSYAYEHHWASYHPDVVVALISSNMISFAWIQRGMPAQMPPYVLHPTESEHGLSQWKTDACRAYGRLCLPHCVSVNMQRGLYWLGVLDHRIPDPAHPYGALLAHGWLQSDLPAHEANDAWNVFGSDLEHLRDAVASHGAKLVVAFSPCRFDLSDSVFDDEKKLPRERLTIHPAQKLAEICHEQGIVYVDTLDALRAARARLTRQRGTMPSMYIMFDYNHLDHDGHEAVAAALLPQVSLAANPAGSVSIR